MLEFVSCAECAPINVDDIEGLKRFAEEHQIDLTVVGPELPLSLGIADEFRRAKLKIFGPTRNAARIESSKSFAKELMMRCKIPTAKGRNLSSIGPGPPVHRVSCDPTCRKS